MLFRSRLADAYSSNQPTQKLANNRLSRLVKTPKLHMGDTGLACELMGVNATIPLNEGEHLGPLLETFVLQELRRQASWRPD